MDTSAPPPPHTPSVDDDAVARLVNGEEAALRMLHRRYAPLVFSIGARALGAPAAEDVVQDVFLAVWQNRSSFDVTRGTFKAWVLQIARNRISNELRRRRSTNGGSESSAQGARAEIDVESIADETCVDEVHWAAYRRSAIRSAIGALPPAERQALSLAYLDELTNAQVASFLQVPLGTTKSRIRTGLRRLAPLLAALVAVGAVLWVRNLKRDSALTQRALRMTTASDVVPLRLAPAPDLPPAAHGTYRARPGGDVAVLTATMLPPIPEGQEYDAWVRYRGQWTWLGVLAGADGDARSVTVADVRVHGDRPEIVEVTRESVTSGHVEPTGSTALTWPSP